MRRREFVTLFGSALAALPAAAYSQQNRKVPHIGYLMDRSGPPGVLDEGFFAGLARARLCGGGKRSDRLSLDGWQKRASSGARK